MIGSYAIAHLLITVSFRIRGAENLGLLGVIDGFSRMLGGKAVEWIGKVIGSIGIYITETGRVIGTGLTDIGILIKEIGGLITQSQNSPL